tara:strand:- start:19 stop:852 length:834 start_codon:yes stop_codon:yes gene_type:complete
MTFLYQIDDMFDATIISRPSKTCKSPYVADVIVDGFGDTVYMAHAPSLGCGGLCETGCKIKVTLHPDPKTCTFVIQQAYVTGRNEEERTIVGIHPKHAEKIVNRSLHMGIIPTLDDVTYIKSEVKMLNSRFDFTCIDKNGVQTVVEVKHVPLADFEDITKKERKGKKYGDEYDWNSKISYFPDGYRKKAKDPVSPRALKHIQELERLKVEHGNNIRCIMCYVIQRPDSKVFQPSVLDEHYRNAFMNAYENGVEIIPIQVEWDNNGECIYHGKLEINI